MAGSEDSGEERRGGDRIPINEEFSRDSSTWVSDLSRGGVFVHSAELLPVGSLIELRFTILVEDLTVIEAVAKVVRHSRRPQGMGVEFVSLSDQMARQIDALLEQRRPLDSGTPLRLPEPHQLEPRQRDISDDDTTRARLARPAPVDLQFGEASFEPVVDDDEDETATTSFPRIPTDTARGEATTVFRPPPIPGQGSDGADDERTRQFPAVTRGQPKTK
ncbi:PilZ domain-containing protein [Enhygromyxa salina]|uniref:PilZ domain protein n=1 Tax=Enhygromyxa salina TaxID=215803 RepID=A0A2S9YX36_9BACT|nr:PilZ domain-containing protein [Enhygromyxa salina]PRQ09637.1 PilZ domain protein [Enhygromyxa salina]